MTSDKEFKFDEFKILLIQLSLDDGTILTEYLIATNDNYQLNVVFKVVNRLQNVEIISYQIPDLDLTGRVEPIKTAVISINHCELILPQNPSKFGVVNDISFGSHDLSYGLSNCDIHQAEPFDTELYYCETPLLWDRQTIIHSYNVE
ncbi:hypothetical protein ACTQ54_01335 [Fundicoccus sp. Sow4_H7]|uniref:hypothetical protein n=1 Tax=Fundicoccus sp. Sow4_H7 TaxID=3438784 RepID=UPI003F8DC76F